MSWSHAYDTPTEVLTGHNVLLHDQSHIAHIMHYHMCIFEHVHHHIFMYMHVMTYSCTCISSHVAGGAGGLVG